MVEPRTVLVLGGARSGKSAYAETLAQSSGKPCVYVATARADDPEMAARIDAHRSRRGQNWRTVEEATDLDAALGQNAKPDTVVVVDCLTVWLSNLLHEERDPDACAKSLSAALTAAAGPVICVSNEVGHGIVPMNQLARRFRDCHGRMNQAVAAACDAVIQVVAGLPIQLKPAATPEIRL